MECFRWPAYQLPAPCESISFWSGDILPCDAMVERMTSLGFEYTFFAEGGTGRVSMLAVTSGLGSPFMFCSSIMFMLYP